MRALGLLSSGSEPKDHGAHIDPTINSNFFRFNALLKRILGSNFSLCFMQHL